MEHPTSSNVDEVGRTTSGTQNPLVELTALGQSIWIDYLDRGLIVSGAIKRHIEEHALRGVTSNPTIFEKALSSVDLYDQPIAELARHGKQPPDIYESLATHDVQMAADLFRPVYDRLDGRDGFASIEVSPEIAHDTEATIVEARRLWSEVDRPNAMIKVPATKAGVPAIERLVAEGINVNVTLLFGLERYEEVANAYLAGLETRAAAGKPVRVASVASFFLSRIDVMVDAQLAELGRGGKVTSAAAAGLHGQVAIASARLAYQTYKRLFHGGDRFRHLHAKGARPQRLLWASTGTKDRAYSDVKYIEALIGDETINTVPLETLNAYLDHGHPAVRLEDDLDGARVILRELGAAGIDLGAVTERLEQEGVEKFNKSYEHLLRTVSEKARPASSRP